MPPDSPDLKIHVREKKNRVEYWDFYDKNLALEGRTMIVVTHEMGFAREVSNHVVFLHQGRIEEEGDPRVMLSNPRGARLQQFLSGSLK